MLRWEHGQPGPLPASHRPRNLDDYHLIERQTIHELLIFLSAAYVDPEPPERPPVRLPPGPGERNRRCRRDRSPPVPSLDRATDSQTLLAYLDRINLFLVPLDERRIWYRYHHLFAELLRARLHQQHPDLTPRLHRRACDWYSHHGLTGEAIDHALAADDVDRAADLIEQAVDETLMRSQISTFLEWVGALPETALKNRPRLAVYQAGLQLLGGRSAPSKLTSTISTASSTSLGGPRPWLKPEE